MALVAVRPERNTVILSKRGIPQPRTREELNAILDRLRDRQRADARAPQGAHYVKPDNRALDGRRLRRHLEHLANLEADCA